MSELTITPSRLPLHPKHKIFADEYLKTGKIRDSAIHAGAKENSAHVTGHKWLRRPDVQQYLAHMGAKLAEQQEDLQSRVIKELEQMAFANIQKFLRVDDSGQPCVDFSGATEEDFKALSGFKSKVTERFDSNGRHIATDKEAAINFADKYRGLELLGRHLGMFKEAEQRVVVDVADRLLNARQRLARLEDRER